MKRLLFILLLFQLQPCFCQKDTSTKVLYPGGYLNSYIKNAGHIITQPLRWKTKNWLIFGATVGTTTALILLDDEINKPFARWSVNNQAYSKAGAFAGATPVAIGSSLLTLGIAAAIKNQKLKAFALDNIQAQIFTGAFTYGVKNIFGRARPGDGRGAKYFDGPFKSNHFESFFSGHTSVSFSTATMIFLHSKKKWWVGLLSYGTASAIGVSRMLYQKHWASDVFLGAVSGWAVSSFIYHQNEKQRALPQLKLVL